MEYASRVTEIINAFSPEPLKGEQMQRFYYSDTMEYRMSAPMRINRSEYTMLNKSKSILQAIVFT